MFALGTKLSCTNFDLGKSPPPLKIKAVSWLTRIDHLINEYTKIFVGITIMNKIYSIISVCVL